MIRYLQIALGKEDVGDKVFQCLCKLAPKRIPSSCNFDARLRDDSPECAAVLHILEQAGLRPRGKFEKPGPGQYSCYPNYDYEPEDFERADLFTMTPIAYLQHIYGRTPEGAMRIHRRSTTGRGDLLAGANYGSLVSGSLKEELESQGFVGLAFRPTVVVQGDLVANMVEIPWSKARRSPLWELSSTVVLPRLSPRCKLVNDRGEPIKDNDWSKGVFLPEDEFPSGQLHYRRCDIERLPAFDVAYSYEPFGYTRQPHLFPHRHRLVMSRRVYDFFCSKPYRIGWRPVYYDDE